MIEKLITTITKSLSKQKEYILRIEDNFKQYVSDTDKKIDLITNNEKVRDDFIIQKVNMFLASIPLPKDADNEYILGILREESNKYISELDNNIKFQTSEYLESVQFTQEKYLQEMDTKLSKFMESKLDEYRNIHYKTVNEAIKTQIERFPKPKDGKDAEVDYNAIKEVIISEVKSNKSVLDIDIVKNDLKITYTDGTEKKVSLPKGNVVINSGGNGGASLSNIDEVTDLLETDFLILTRDNKQVKISAINFIPKTVDGGGA